MSKGVPPADGTPSHPPVRHYDRSELMKLTNLRCGKAIPDGIPSPHQGLPLPLSQRLERDEAWAKCGSLDRRIRAGGAARRSTQHSTCAKTAPPAPPKGARRPQHPGVVSRAGIVCLRAALTSSMGRQSAARILNQILTVKINLPERQTFPNSDCRLPNAPLLTESKSPPPWSPALPAPGAPRPHRPAHSGRGWGSPRRRS